MKAFASHVFQSSGKRWEGARKQPNGSRLGLEETDRTGAETEGTG